MNKEITHVPFSPGLSLDGNPVVRVWLTAQSILELSFNQGRKGKFYTILRI